jgi:hypothetical protein
MLPWSPSIYFEDSVGFFYNLAQGEELICCWFAWLELSLLILNSRVGADKQAVVHYFDKDLGMSRSAGRSLDWSSWSLFFCTLSTISPGSVFPVEFRLSKPAASHRRASTKLRLHVYCSIWITGSKVVIPDNAWILGFSLKAWWTSRSWILNLSVLMDSLEIIY